MSSTQGFFEAQKGQLLLKSSVATHAKLHAGTDHLWSLGPVCSHVGLL